MTDLIAVVGVLSFIALIIFAILTYKKFKQNDKAQGMKFLKFTGISLLLVVILMFVDNLIEKPTDSAQPKEKGKIEASVDNNEKEQKEKEAEEKALAEQKVKEEQAAKEKVVQEKTQVSESKPKAETKPVIKEVVIETDKKEDIKKMVENIVSTDINTNMIKTNIKEITVNNYQAEENQYIVLPYLKYEMKSTKKTTVETLEMHSDHIAAKLYEQPGIEEITVFWEVPYHLTGENIAKFNYMRSENGMAKNEKWLAPVLQ